MQAIEWIQVNVLGSNAPPRSLPKLMQQVAQWQERARSRYLLQQLDDRMLRDIGLSRSDVHRECTKFFWQR